MLCTNSFSAASLVAPYRLTGLTALSVLSAITFLTPASSAASITLLLPRMLVLIASIGLYSQAGTCLSAAAWTTISTPCMARRRRSLVAHIADEVAQARVVEAADAHFMLFELVPAEDDQLGRMVLRQHDLDEFLAERAGAAGDQDDFIVPVHSDFIASFIFFADHDQRILAILAEEVREALFQPVEQAQPEPPAQPGVDQARMKRTLTLRQTRISTGMQRAQLGLDPGGVVLVRERAFGLSVLELVGSVCSLPGRCC